MSANFDSERQKLERLVNERDQAYEGARTAYAQADRAYEQAKTKLSAVDREFITLVGELEQSWSKAVEEQQHVQTKLEVSDKRNKQLNRTLASTTTELENANGALASVEAQRDQLKSRYETTVEKLSDTVHALDAARREVRTLRHLGSILLAVFIGTGLLFLSFQIDKEDRWIPLLAIAAVSAVYLSIKFVMPKEERAQWGWLGRMTQGSTFDAIITSFVGSFLAQLAWLLASSSP